jgi:hypothetical protein
VTTRLAQEVSVAGLEATYNAAAAGDKVHPGVLLHVVNDDASDKTLTLATPGTAFGQPIGDQVITITAGEARFVEVPEVGFTASDGLVPLTWSATTSVTFAVLSV